MIASPWGRRIPSAARARARAVFRYGDSLFVDPRRRLPVHAQRREDHAAARARRTRIEKDQLVPVRGRPPYAGAQSPPSARRQLDVVSAPPVPGHGSNGRSGPPPMERAVRAISSYNSDADARPAPGVRADNRSASRPSRYARTSRTAPSRVLTTGRDDAADQPLGVRLARARRCRTPADRVAPRVLPTSCDASAEHRLAATVSDLLDLAGGLRRASTFQRRRPVLGRPPPLRAPRRRLASTAPPVRASPSWRAFRGLRPVARGFLRAPAFLPPPSPFFAPLPS